MRAAVLSDNLRLTLHMPACYIIRFPNALGLIKKVADSDKFFDYLALESLIIPLSRPILTADFADYADLGHKEHRAIVNSCLRYRQ